MLSNYFKTALRNFTHNKGFTLINIIGLSIGLASCILILLYVDDEISFDKFHKNAARLFRVVSEVNRSQNSAQKMGSSCFPVGPAIKNEILGVRDYVRMKQSDAIVRLKNDVIHESIQYCDKGFFSVFSFPLLYGNPASVLDQMNSVVLTKAKAIKYFGTINVVGKELSLKFDSAFENFIIAGVAENPPQNSSIQFDFILPFVKYEKSPGVNNNEWLGFNLNTFVLLKPDANPKQIESQMPVLVDKYVGGKLSEINKKNNGNITLKFSLQNIKDIHLDTSLAYHRGVDGGIEISNPVYSYILGGIAIFILIISSINFVNLSTGLSLKRAKEIGIRKVVGGEKKQLMIQFICESFLLCSFAFLSALLLIEISLPLFDQLSNKQIRLSYIFEDYRVTILSILLLLITSLAVGSYPAFIMSRFKPVDVLYSRFRLAGKNIFSKTLVIIQFALAILLVTVTIIFQTQFNFLINRDLGYDDENIVRVKLPSDKTNIADVFKYELLKNPDIIKVTNNYYGLYINGAKAGSKDIGTAINRIDEDYLPILHIPILKGRNFNKLLSTDITNAVIVNETFAREAGWSNPVGEKILFGDDVSKMMTIVGMVKDYNFQSLHEKIMPLVLHFGCIPQGLDQTLIKIKPENIPQTVAFIGRIYKKLSVLTPFEYDFLDLANSRQYESEKNWKTIIFYSSALCILISCLGLFGLTSLSVVRRTKELGIRKVLGAKVYEIVSLMSREYLKLVLIAFVLSIPFAWYSGNKWLENFAYRITINWWVFIAAGMAALLITLFTICFLVIKAATANPVKSLRSE